MDASTLHPDLFRDLSVYQDVTIDGRTVLKGERDCQSRWEAIVPHLPDGGVLLDIGSNFGWFGLRWCERFEQGLVVSVEADDRSARVQRAVLDANRQDRIHLLTAKAGAPMMRRFVRAGQRFDAVLLFSILHWVRDHRRMCEALDAIAGRIFVEQPDPRETGAGDGRIRREIGPIGPYLGQLFPDRPVVHLASWPGHRDTEFPRELWMVGEPAGWQGSGGVLDRAALLDLEPAWPPRSWWQRRPELAHLPGKLRALPETGIFTLGRRWRRGLRYIGNQIRRWINP